MLNKVWANYDYEKLSARDNKTMGVTTSITWAATGDRLKQIIDLVLPLK
ncbi:MAG: hypothetical protein AAFO76_06570 [Cyanobacteria bacterium J06607_15]